MSNSLTTTTPSLLASGERVVRVLLQTATVLVQHHDGMTTTTACVLLDGARNLWMLSSDNIAKSRWDRKHSSWKYYLVTPNYVPKLI